jgi:hypothetical protein
MSHGSIVEQKQGEKGDTGHLYLENLLTAILWFQSNAHKKTCRSVS